MLEYLLGILNVCILEVCAESRSFAVPHHKCNVQGLIADGMFRKMTHL